MTAATDYTGISRFQRCLALIQERLGRNTPTQVIRALIAVATDDRQNLAELATLLGASQSTASRQLKDLGALKRGGKPGYGVVEVQADPLNACANQYRLTARGEQLVRDLCEIIRYRAECHGSPLRSRKGSDGPQGS